MNFENLPFERANLKPPQTSDKAQLIQASAGLGPSPMTPTPIVSIASVDDFISFID
jgi:hypothetical protein